MSCGGKAARGGQNDEGVRDLLAGGVVAGDHGRVGDAGMAQQNSFQLRRRDLVTLVFDQLLDPVDDEEVALLVDEGESPVCSQPSALDGARGLGGPAEVAEHHLGAADEKLAGQAGAEVRRRWRRRRCALACSGSRPPIEPGLTEVAPKGWAWVTGESSVMP